MSTLPGRCFWATSLIWATFYVIGTLAIETLTTEQMPELLLESLKKVNGTEFKQLLNNSRRIILGREANNKRPYMVYLKLPRNSEKFQDYKRWLCAGVIIHEEYILTSAACIEDVKHFYVVSGTHKFSFVDDRYNNNCIKNGAKKAVWKCIPRNYVFDGHENDNIRWMNNDVAIVKLEDEFDFTRRVRGCDYAPRPVCYNNQSIRHEEPGTTGSIAGWGSLAKYNDWVNSRKNSGRRGDDSDSQALLETSVTILDKTVCKKRWGRRYHNIIENYMICTKDIAAELTEICQEKYVDCTDIVSESAESVRRSWNPEDYGVHSSHHSWSISRRLGKLKDGGFCENDHGGPLVIGEGVTSLVIGIISACLVKERTNKCYGPFLYTSIFKNRVLINCAIYKDAGANCQKLFRSGTALTETTMSWSDHPDGPAKNEIKAVRRKDVEQKESTVAAASTIAGSTVNVINNATNDEKDAADSPVQHKGVILRSRADEEDEKEKLIAKIKNGRREDAGKVDPKAENATTSKPVIKERDTDDAPRLHQGVILRSGPDEEDAKEAMIAKFKAANKTVT